MCSMYISDDFLTAANAMFLILRIFPLPQRYSALINCYNNVIWMSPHVVREIYCCPAWEICAFTIQQKTAMLLPEIEMSVHQFKLDITHPGIISAFRWGVIAKGNETSITHQFNKLVKCLTLWVIVNEFIDKKFADHRRNDWA